MEEQGTVIESAGGVARVRIDRSEGCDGCAFCELAESGSHMIARAVDRIGVSAGDRVKIETRGVSPVKAGVFLFLLPLLSLFAGYGVGALAGRLIGAPGSDQTTGAAGALIFFLASFGVLSVSARKGKAGRPDAVRPPSSVIVEKL